MEQTEDQNGNLRVGFETEEALKSAHVVECFVDHGEANDGVDEIRVRVNIAEHSGEQGDAVADREQADVQYDVLEFVEEEDHAHEEGQMIVSGHHVLRPEIHEGGYGSAFVRLDEACIALRHVVGARRNREHQPEDDHEDGDDSRRTAELAHNSVSRQSVSPGGRGHPGKSGHVRVSDACMWLI